METKGNADEGAAEAAAARELRLPGASSLAAWRQFGISDLTTGYYRCTESSAPLLRPVAPLASPLPAVFEHLARMRSASPPEAAHANMGQPLAQAGFRAQSAQAPAELAEQGGGKEKRPAAAAAKHQSE